jgi:hypothetical protein
MVDHVPIVRVTLKPHCIGCHQLPLSRQLIIIRTVTIHNKRDHINVRTNFKLTNREAKATGVHWPFAIFSHSVVE